MLVSTGASYWGTRSARSYPWTIGWQPDYIAEGRLYGAPHQGEPRRQEDRDPSTRTTTTARTTCTGLRSALGKKYADANIVAQGRSRRRRRASASQMTRIKASRRADLRPPRHPRPRLIRPYATGRGARPQPRADLPQLRVPRQGRVPEHRRSRSAGAAVRQRVARPFSVPSRSARTRSGRTTAP